MKVYATVVATNALGLNASATSQPIAVDNTPPVAGSVVELSDKYFIVAGDDNATAAANVYTCDTAEGRWKMRENGKSVGLEGSILLWLEISTPVLLIDE